LLTLAKGTFEDHLETLERDLYRLRQAGLKINGNKLFFAKTKLEYLGYWITCDGIKPLPDKVKAILAINTPRNCRELHSFIGIINYYQDMWVKRSHVLAPLATLTSLSVVLGFTHRFVPDSTYAHGSQPRFGFPEVNDLMMSINQPIKSIKLSSHFTYKLTLQKQ
jgi:hypothetical protein